MRVRCYPCTLFVAHGLMYTCPLFLTLLVVYGKGNRLVPSLRRTNQGLKLVRRARGEKDQQGFHTLC
ncbi:unnamed protein product [Withania somnifera]